MPGSKPSGREMNDLKSPRMNEEVRMYVAQSSSVVNGSGQESTLSRHVLCFSDSWFAAFTIRVLKMNETVVADWEPSGTDTCAVFVVA